MSAHLCHSEAIPFQLKLAGTLSIVHGRQMSYTLTVLSNAPTLICYIKNLAYYVGCTSVSHAICLMDIRMMINKVVMKLMKN